VTDDHRLKHRLARLAATGLSGPEGREIRSVRDQGLLSGLLREIDETILPRLLTVKNGRTDTLKIEAGNRRVLRVVDGTFGGAPGAVGKLFGANVSVEDKETLVVLKTVLEHFVEGSDSLTITSDKIGRDVGASEIGMAATTLADTWGLSIGRSPHLEADAEVFAAFLEANAEPILAWVRLGDTSDCDGEETHLSRLATFAEDELPTIIVDGGAFEDPGYGSFFFAIEATNAKDGSLVYAKNGKESIVFFCETPALNSIARSWSFLTAL